ncbi:MAG: hypothetical protein NTZ56_04240 [Acidobacteria bacterium]|nr:hypothetical protein [Acidobacteriota bacterium]
MAVGIEIPEERYRRLKAEADVRQVSVEDACVEAITNWLQPALRTHNTELDEQLRIAKQGMVHFRDTLRELAN